MPMLIMEDLDNFPNKSMPSDFSDHDSDKRIYVSASQDCRKICYAEPDMKSSVDLHPLHLKDLRKSGLSDETIEVAGFKSVPPNDIKRKLGFDVSGLVSTYEIPYDKTFSRFRCFYMQGQNGRPKLPKYLQKKVAGNRLYIPGGARAVLNDPSVPLYIAEGEKKAA
jgi:hypothetical protein